MPERGLIAYPGPGNSPVLRDALLSASLPVDDLAEAGRSFFRFVAPDGETIGFGGIEPYGDNVLIRSIVVLLPHRGEGFGRAITEELLALAEAIGARRAFLLTTSAIELFEYLNFTRIERQLAPADILNTRQAKTICATAALLTRPLSVQ